VRLDTSIVFAYGIPNNDGIAGVSVSSDLWQTDFMLVGAGLSGSSLGFDLSEDREDVALAGPLTDRVDDNTERGKLAKTADPVFAYQTGSRKG
jgi:hypothetical protein